MIPVYLLLFSSTGIVMLIACANIANLLLARGVSRAGEFAVRLSLGASRGQLITQLLIESLVLAVLGGLAGVFVARALLDILRGLLPGAGEPQVFGLDGPRPRLRVRPVTPDGAHLRHAAGIAQHACARDDDGEDADGRDVCGQWRRAALGTRACQISLALALLVVAGLFARSLINIGRVDLGMQISNLTTFRVSPVLNGYTPERSQALFEQIEDQLNAFPGVTFGDQSTIPLLEGAMRARTSRCRVTSRVRMPIPMQAPRHRSALLQHPWHPIDCGPRVHARRLIRVAARGGRQRSLREKVQSRIERGRHADGAGPERHNEIRHRDCRLRAGREIQRGKGRDSASVLPSVPPARNTAGR